MLDIQNSPDNRNIRIQSVGISNLHLPLVIENQPVLGIINFTTALNANIKGTHMSRFVEILQSHTDINEIELQKILQEATEKLSSDSAEITIKFKYFVEKTSPISLKKSLLDVDCIYKAKLQKNLFDLELTTVVPFTSLCPCSKEISDYGAHNQRSIATIKLKFKENSKRISIKNLVTLIENEGSQPVYSLLKREDEKFVTEQAYNNPKFVEDILRDLVLKLRMLEGIKSLSVECENFESIHNHNAFAKYEEEIE